VKSGIAARRGRRQVVAPHLPGVVAISGAAKAVDREGDGHAGSAMIAFGQAIAEPMGKGNAESEEISVC
jgi:hypothetical protein